MPSVFSFLCYFIGIVFVCDSQENVPFLWPYPVYYESSGLVVNVSSNFTFSCNLNDDILNDAFDRYTKLIFNYHQEEITPATAINKLTINVESKDDTLQYGIDESYNLTINKYGGESTLYAKTIYGALHGLETFSQLVVYDFLLGYYTVNKSVTHDYPRFGSRGILIDTGRHFQPLYIIYRLLDAMAYNKMNALHIHLTDSQSEPYESKVWPLLWEGAYSKYERYSSNDMKALVKYAKYRGIRIIYEFDMPGHASSFCHGYPELCPYNGTNNSCHTINPSTNNNNFTYNFIDKLIAEASEIFPDEYIHLGGDEASIGCWANDPSIAAWMKTMNFTSTHQAYQYFLQQTHKIAASYGKKVINWDDAMSCSGYLNKSITIIESYHYASIKTIVNAGYKALLSNEDGPNSWYLNKINITWENIYNNVICKGINESMCAEYVLGGELSMWGENVDASDLETTIWPRAAAGAEKLWSPLNVTNNTHFHANTHGRIEYFRCLLNIRGIEAPPVNNQKARSPPDAPFTCYRQ